MTERLEPEGPSRLARRLAQLPEREQIIVVAVLRGMRVEDLAEALDWPTRSVRDVLARANVALAAPARFCECGCRAELPAVATGRRRFLDDSHRLRAWRKGAGVKRNERRRSQTDSESRHSERRPAGMSTQEAVKSVAEIVAESVAAGRSAPEDMVADVLEREGFIVRLSWPSEHSIDTHPGRLGLPTSYIAAEPLTLSDAEGGSRNLGVGDLLHAEEARVAGTQLSGLLSRHQILAVPSDSGVVGLASALRLRVSRLEQQLADAAERA